MLSNHSENKKNESNRFLTPELPKSERRFINALFDKDFIIDIKGATAEFLEEHNYVIEKSHVIQILRHKNYDSSKRAISPADLLNCEFNKDIFFMGEFILGFVNDVYNSLLMIAEDNKKNDFILFRAEILTQKILYFYVVAEKRPMSIAGINTLKNTIVNFIQVSFNPDEISDFHQESIYHKYLIQKHSLREVIEALSNTDEFFYCRLINSGFSEEEADLVATQSLNFQKKAAAQYINATNIAFPSFFTVTKNLEYPDLLYALALLTLNWFAYCLMTDQINDDSNYKKGLLTLLIIGYVGLVFHRLYGLAGEIAANQPRELEKKEEDELRIQLKIPPKKSYAQLLVSLKTHHVNREKDFWQTQIKTFKKYQKGQTSLADDENVSLETKQKVDEISENKPTKIIKLPQAKEKKEDKWKKPTAPPLRPIAPPSRTVVYQLDPALTKLGIFVAENDTTLNCYKAFFYFNDHEAEIKTALIKNDCLPHGHIWIRGFGGPTGQFNRFKNLTDKAYEMKFRNGQRFVFFQNNANENVDVHARIAEENGERQETVSVPTYRYEYDGWK